jgi:hypothetical protein
LGCGKKIGMKRTSLLCKLICKQFYQMGPRNEEFLMAPPPFGFRVTRRLRKIAQFVEKVTKKVAKNAKNIHQSSI